MNIKTEASKNIAQRLSFQTAVKDQAGIAQELAEGQEVEEVYHLSDAGFFDEFFYFLAEIGVINSFFALDPKVVTRPSTIRFHSVILIYLMRIVAGLAFFWHIEPIILQSQALMHLVGFNGVEILKGTSNRGAKNPSVEFNTDDPVSDDADDIIRGPICADSVATYIQAIPAWALERLFNGVISILAANSFFPKHVHATLDASEIQSTERCEGCGMVKKEKPPELRLRKGRIKKVLERVFGFKIWVVWDPTTSLPLAMRFANINVADIKLAQEVVLQAITNLGTHATLTSIAFDRGFTDGVFWWWLNDVMKITFYVPAKKNMAVYQDALACVDSGVRQIRERDRKVGHGKNQTTVVDRWEMVGITGLTSAGFYGTQGSGAHENAKAFQANHINAVVVVHDPFCKNNPLSDTMVILTNDVVNKPLKPYDQYDRRSDMENGLFRESKQAWFIQRAPKATARAFRSHAYLTIITMALTTAFRAWLELQGKKERDGKDTGIRKYREKIRQENGNKLIVFNKGRYAIFETYELVILCGRAVAMPRGIPENISISDILKKYGAYLE
jgi:Transposase DDE domain